MKITYWGVLSLIVVFQLGWLAHDFVLSEMRVIDAQPTSFQAIKLDSPQSTEVTHELQTPADRIHELQISVLNDKVILDIANAQWSTFTPTKSMVPVLDKGTNAIQVVPTRAEDLKVGDIVSYQSEFLNNVVIHRIIELGNDEQGWYALVKGDNNAMPDPERVRFRQIKRVVVAIVY